MGPSQAAGSDGVGGNVVIVDIRMIRCHFLTYVYVI
jgi:hypothetical protein